MFLPADVVLYPCPNFSLKFMDTNDIIPSKDVALGSNFEFWPFRNKRKIIWVPVFSRGVYLVLCPQTFLEAQECSGFWWHRIGIAFFWLRWPLSLRHLGGPCRRQLHPTSFPEPKTLSRHPSATPRVPWHARSARHSAVYAATAPRSVSLPGSFFLLGEVIHWGIR